MIKKLKLVGRSALRHLVMVLGLVPLAALAAADSPAVPAAPAAVPWKLLFSSLDELADPWGKLHIGVTPVRLIRECGPATFTEVGWFPLPGGGWEVFGRDQTAPGDGSLRLITKGTEAYNRTVQWKLLRTTTRDGVTFDPPQVVFEPPAAAWADNFAMAYNPDAREYLLLNLKADRSGFAYVAFFSSDGRQWQEHPGGALFYDGDAMSLFWSPVLHRFVCVSKSLQPHPKHIPDHGGRTPALGDDSQRDRRVLMMRSSPDGRRWEPSVSMPDVWNRNGHKSSVAAGFLTLPDASDPPDLEFYSGTAFWYHDRAYMMVLNYAASPLSPRKHGPQLDHEWWTSRDGLLWERPARGVNALETFPAISRLETAPFVTGGMIQFRRAHLLMGLPEDRISGVGVRANGEFSTKTFKMPAADLFLNASAPSADRPFAKAQAYVMAAVLDPTGAVIPGFEPEKCLIRNEDRADIPLKWNGASARQLAGKTIRLRFFLRSATLHAVTARGNP